MKVSFECGDAAFAISGRTLYVNGRWTCEFPRPEDAEAFAKAMNAYGDAMYAEGYSAAGMEAL